VISGKRSSELPDSPHQTVSISTHLKDSSSERDDGEGR
jgi:hypothetical protein